MSKKYQTPDTRGLVDPVLASRAPSAVPVLTFARAALDTSNNGQLLFVPRETKWILQGDASSNLS